MQVGKRLFVAVLGHRNSGKSQTWNDLFGRTVRRGSTSRSLELKPGECVEVFLISGSFEERGEYAGDILKNQDARIILCSMQYTEQVVDTIEYVVNAGFDIFVQWLNPGFSDVSAYFDRLGLPNQLLWKNATISMRDGTTPTKQRVQEIKEFVFGWATYRNLVLPCNAT
jgi:hypothetical protein